MKHKKYFLLAIIVLIALAMTACAGPAGPEGPAGPVGPEGPAGPAGTDGASAEAAEAPGCTDCHNDTTIITAKQQGWSEATHGHGEAYVRGTSASCAGCHSGTAFVAMADAGLNPSEVEAGDAEPTRQDCRACHNIHETYTGADWSLTTVDPVDLYAFEGVTFDGGKGNLCVNCHQPRRGMVAEDGIVNVSSTHWGPHHGPQSALLLGVGGGGEVEGSPSAHATMVEDTCVACHLSTHTFSQVSVASCQGCHADAEDFDINGLQTEVDELLHELETALIAKGMLTEDSSELVEELAALGLLEEGHPGIVVGEYPEAEAAALWNYIYIYIEDGSHGVHNPTYTKALLEASIEALQ